jgi:hypothetical protein
MEAHTKKILNRSKGAKEAAMDVENGPGNGPPAGIQ